MSAERRLSPSLARGWAVGKSAAVSLGVGAGPSESEVIGRTFQEKPRFVFPGVTVLKLTQVGEVNILRRSREPSLRN